MKCKIFGRIEFKIELNPLYHPSTVLFVLSKLFRTVSKQFQIWNFNSKSWILSYLCYRIPYKMQGIIKKITVLIKNTTSLLLIIYQNIYIITPHTFVVDILWYFCRSLFYYFIMYFFNIIYTNLFLNSNVQNLQRPHFAKQFGNVTNYYIQPTTVVLLMWSKILYKNKRVYFFLYFHYIMLHILEQ